MQPPSLPLSQQHQLKSNDILNVTFIKKSNNTTERSVPAFGGRLSKELVSHSGTNVSIQEKKLTDA